MLATSGIRLLEDSVRDLRYGLRTLLKSPAFTIVAVMSLALGIGANAALFSVVDALLLRTLPVHEPERLVLFEWQAPEVFRVGGTWGYGTNDWPTGYYGSSSFHQRVFDRMRQQDSPLSDLFAFADLWDLNILTGGQAEKAEGQGVSGNYFTGLGVHAMLGRTIMPADDDAAAMPVAVLSYPYWKDRFGASPDAIGKEIQVNNISFTVVGVAPQGFNGTLQVDTRPVISVPLAFEPAIRGDQSPDEKPGKPGAWWLNLMGRLKPGATAEQARQSLNGAFQQVALEIMPAPRKEGEPAKLEPKDYPELVALPGSRGMTEARKRYSSTVYLLLGVVGLVLLIACANVANLLLSRATLRAPEISIRLAVGAGRRRLIRQLLTESVLLSTLGGVAGIGVAALAKQALAAMGGARGALLPADVDYRLNWRVLGFTLAVSLLAGTVFGLAPAWRATRVDLITALKEGSRGAGAMSRSLLAKVLVVAQVSLSLMLLVGAGLFVRTLRNLQQVSVGFNQENLLLFGLQPGGNGYKKGRLVQFYQRLSASLEGIPGVSSATFCSVRLISDHSNTGLIILPGETPQSAANHDTDFEVVRENYFSTMEIPLLRGREFTSQDDERAPLVAVISQELARRYFPGEDPIGKRIGFGRDNAGKIEIIGIARDTKYSSQREDIAPLLYTPWLQKVNGIGRMSFALRAAGEPSSLVTAVREAVRDVDSNLPITDITTQTAQSAETLTQERILARLLSFFGLLALMLAAIGLYGVMAYSVAQRTGEIGIRIALGAQTNSVLGLVIWQGVKLVLIGLVVGTLGAIAAKQIIASQLYGVKPTDPATILAVSGLLVSIALVACFIPARRAARVDPMTALRNE
jgi:predicted permease